MEDLFFANLSINNKQIPYRVVFENDNYSFKSEAEEADIRHLVLKGRMMNGINNRICHLT